ncbi:MAG: hypothetical protein ACXVDD_14735 [Polyangia bacterium]
MRDGALRRRRTGVGGAHLHRRLRGDLVLPHHTLSAALGGLHYAYDIRWWHILIANVVAMLVSGLLFGWLRPPGSYGLHLVIGIEGYGRHFSFGISD